MGARAVLEGWRLGVHRCEVVFEGCVAELVNRASLPQELPVKSVFKQAPEVYPAAFLEAENYFRGIRETVIIGRLARKRNPGSSET
jgi:hypothetical protein